MNSRFSKFILNLGMAVFASSTLMGCTYLSSASKQAEYKRLQAVEPSQRNLKHLLSNQTFFVYGKVLDENKHYSGYTLGVAAFSSKYKKNELVDTTFISNASTHYGLNLPEGSYDIMVFVDADGDKQFRRSEVIGQHQLILSSDKLTGKVVSEADITLTDVQSADWDIAIPVPKAANLEDSLFFPKGTIRTLDDPLFDKSNATLGMYEPSALLELSPTMFHALEEDSYKMPVIFVHGIGGSPREFSAIVDQLDRDKFKPWFFYYPSGADLDQLSELFYSIFLSGETANSNLRPITIVAHSMGGLIAREALNHIKGDDKENKVELFITISSPLGGHPAAANGEKHGLITLPSWIDLNPNNAFIERLYRNPLPEGLNYHLLYTYNNKDTLKFGPNSDGVVPLSSQLEPRAQAQATKQLGIDNTHTGVLDDEITFNHIINAINQVKGLYPDSHMPYLTAEGIDVSDQPQFTQMEKYILRSSGAYLTALASGEIHHLDTPVLEHFVQMANGEADAQNEVERAWSKYIQFKKSNNGQ